VLDERRRQRRLPRARADVTREAVEERTVARARPLELEGPGVRRFVAQSVLALDRREVRGDRDSVRFSVDDFTARQLTVGQTHLRGRKAEPGREAIVQKLETGALVFRLNREERAHAIRLTRWR
jgi:hypothetical protein